MASPVPDHLWQSTLVALGAGLLATASGPPAAAPRPSHGASAEGSFARSRQAGRWASPICLQIVGLTPQQEIAVAARIEQVARAVDVAVQPIDCEGPNLEIAFSPDPQTTLDVIAKADPAFLGDRASDTRNIKTVTRPIQAWYVANSLTVAQNGTNDAGRAKDMRALVVYQGRPADIGPRSGALPALGRQFTNVLVIVDLGKTEKMSLGLLADYVTMVALSQPGALGQCDALPSITDLFAACPGRFAPDGLTQADAAYLTALYPRAGGGLPYGDEASTTRRMTGILAAAKAAAL